MFGYVNADKPNMLMKDYATYRAYYCGLCKSLGKQNNTLMRFTVNYDIAFLTLLAHNYRKQVPVFKEERCIAHPIGKKFAVVQSNPIQSIIADINVILGYYKLEDDVIDGGKLKHRLAKMWFYGKYKRAEKRLPDLAVAVKKNYDDLRKLELAKEQNLDKLCHCFATMLQKVGKTACDTQDDNLDDLCYNLGRWIYLIDAYDDLDKDIAEGKFNPLVPMGKLVVTEKELYDTVKFNLYLAVSEIRRAYDKMDITVSEGALSNIIYCGLQARTDMILERRGAKCKKTLL